jgi:DNA-binding beta-propeller fold protein YncE
MLRRVVPLLCLAMLSLPAIPAAPAQAAAGEVRITDADALMLTGGRAFLNVVATSTIPCTFWNLTASIATPFAGGVPFYTAPMEANWSVRIQAETGPGNDIYTVQVSAVCGLGNNLTSTKYPVIIPRYRPPRSVPTPKSPDASSDAKSKRAGKNTASSTKVRSKQLQSGPAANGTGPRAELLDVDSGAATVLAAATARDAWNADLLVGVAAVQPPAGLFSQAVVVGAPPPPAILPASLTGTSATVLQAALANRGEQISIGTAANEALARREAAFDAGDPVSASKRGLEAATLLERWASVLGGQAALDATAQAAIAPLVSPVTLTADELKAAARAGVPPDVGAALVQAGAPARVGRGIAADLYQLTVIDVTASAPMLADPVVAAADVQSAIDLRKLAAALRSPGDGAATAPAPGPREAKGIGQLRRVSCVSATPSSAPGCVQARGMSGAKYAATSPDGKFVYVGSDGSPGAIAVFGRNLNTGKLTQLKGTAGCYSAAIPGCTVIPHSARVADLNVMPDGRGLVAALYGDGSVVSFTRNVRTGALHWAGCVGQAAGCKKGPGKTMSRVKTVAISPDGRNVYASTQDGVSVVELSRNGSTGRLGVVGCIGRSDYGCTAARAIQGPGGITISRDGLYVYEADQQGWSVSSLKRDVRTGRLTDAGCIAGRDGVSSIPGCAGGLGLAGPEWVTAGPGNTLWVGAAQTSSVVRLVRDKDGGLAMAPVTGACTTDLKIAFGGASLCSGQAGLGGAYGIAVSPDGLNAYVGGYAPGSLTAYRVDPVTGALIQVGSCVGTTGSGCTTTKGLAHAGHTILSPDGRSVMVLAPDSSSLLVFGRRLQPSAVVLPTAKQKLHKGRIAVTVRCPVTATAWCYGTWTAQLLAGSKVALRTKAVELVVRPGGKAQLVVTVPAAVLKRYGSKVKLRLILVAVSKEPFGAKASARRSLAVSRS